MNNIFDFPEIFKHDHPEITNTNEVIDSNKTMGQKAADAIVSLVGSWKFVITQSIILFLWVIVNATAWIMHWDPYPFILMNLFLSLQAAYTAPMIMMSQNRQNARDRIEAHNDYQINLKAEKEIEVILKHLETQDIVLENIYKLINDKKLNNNK
jgi:uncharacterized membrane protein